MNWRSTKMPNGYDVPAVALAIVAPCTGLTNALARLASDRRSPAAVAAPTWRATTRCGPDLAPRRRSLWAPADAASRRRVVSRSGGWRVAAPDRRTRSRPDAGAQRSDTVMSRLTSSSCSRRIMPSTMQHVADHRADVARRRSGIVAAFAQPSRSPRCGIRLRGRCGWRDEAARRRRRRPRPGPGPRRRAARTTIGDVGELRWASTRSSNSSSTSPSALVSCSGRGGSCSARGPTSSDPWTDLDPPVGCVTEERHRSDSRRGAGAAGDGRVGCCAHGMQVRAGCLRSANPTGHPPTDRVIAPGEVPRVVGVQTLDALTRPADAAPRHRTTVIGGNAGVAFGGVAAVRGGDLAGLEFSSRPRRRRRRPRDGSPRGPPPARPANNASASACRRRAAARCGSRPDRPVRRGRPP